jgi:signal transduction histidine kinase
LDALRSTLQEQISELRAYAGELRPPILTQFGLVKAIQAHLETFHNRHPEIQIQFEESSAGPLLPEQACLALFRITQETLNNIVKHAQATQATIRLRKTLEQVSLEIEDNGVGFEIPQDWLELARQKHLGLVGMRERAEALGGSLQVTSQPGQGTKIRVVVRVNHANESSGTTQA